MPIDPSIILGLKQANVPALQDPIEGHGKFLTLQNLMRQGEASDRAIKRQDSLSALLATNPDEESLRRGGFLDEALKVGKDARERARLDAETGKIQADTAKSKYDVHIDQIQRRSSILSTATDQQSWDSARRLVALQDPEIGSQLPVQFDPVLLKTRLAEGQTLVQRLEDARKNEANSESKRHNAATEANAAGQLQNARQRLVFDQAQPKDTYDADRGVLVNARTGAARPVTMGGEAVPGKLSESQKKELSAIDSQKSQVAGALKSVAENANAFGAVRGAATMAGAIPESVAGRFDTDAQRQSRSYVFNVVSKVINERAGAAQSAQELARLRSFLPAETDNADQIKSKLEAFQTYLDDSRAGYDKPQTASPPKQPAASVIAAPKLGDRQGGYVYKGGDPANPKSWEKV